MKALTPEMLAEATALIDQLRSGLLSEEELSRVFIQLRALLPDPYFMAYTVNHEPELDAADVVRRAFAYQPILL
jgi:hypothetical protein